MAQASRLEIDAWLDQRPLGGFQRRLLLICGLLMILDGFDVQAMAYVAPALLADWGLAKPALGPVFSAGLLGLLLGALLFSPLADRFGRRALLLLCTVWFGLGMLATGFAATLEQLLWLRFLTGLGLGGIMPNAMALAGEYSPSRRRVSMMMLISCGFTVGALLGGLLAAWLVPVHGWRAVFLAGGVAPLLLALWMWRQLPESLQFLLSRQRREQALAWLCRLDPAMSGAAASSLALREPVVAASLPHLFRAGRARLTLTLWALSFLNLLLLYFLSNWMPALARDAGLNTQNAILAGAALQLGGVAGTLLLGVWIDRRGFLRVMLPSFALAAAAVAMLGQWGAQQAGLFGLLFAAGFCVVGGQPAINALAANAYPTSLRATGVGWSLGVGRVGSVLGPWLGGELLRQDWSLASLFMLAATPALLAAWLVWMCPQAARPAAV